ncbi:MAG: non-hydrolyzing UDP-N-acetylglucosamine 2-epimerase [Vicinamibacterales bacterium]
MRMTCVVGARPNFMKVAPLVEAARRPGGPTTRLVHTGQHYDERMSALFFEELGLPAPDAFLGVGSGSHAIQTARVMEAFDSELDAWACDVVVVVGDVNSTLACALVSVKRQIPVAHVEAGLRSGDRSMPEEINRILTDQISEVLFTTESSAKDNLLREGISGDRIHFVGNVMIDTLLKNRARASQRSVLLDFSLTERGYALCTLHRPSNVDTPDAAEKTIQALEHIARVMPVVFPLHPRTRNRLQAFSLLDRLDHHSRIRITEPLGYLDFLALMDQARLVFTDSGGIQEETTALGVPCLTFRDSTERPITLTSGSNVLVGVDPSAVRRELDLVLHRAERSAARPLLWDGRSAERILTVLMERFAIKCESDGGVR